MENVKFCLICGTGSLIVDSRVHERTGGILRRRCCPCCGRRWTTLETRKGSRADARHCRACGAASHVIDSRVHDGYILRRRECPICGRRWMTEEHPVKRPGRAD